MDKLSKIHTIEFLVLDSSQYNTIYRQHISMFNRKDSLGVLSLINEMKNEINDKRHISSYLEYLNIYNDIEDDLQFRGSLSNSFTKILDSTSSQIREGNWKKNGTTVNFLRLLIQRDCIALFRNDWFLQNRMYVSKELINHLMTNDEFTFYFYQNREKYLSYDLSYDYLSDVLPKDENLFLPYFDIDKNTVQDLLNKIQSKPLPKNSSSKLVKEYILYKQILEKVASDEWMLMILWM